MTVALAFDIGLGILLLAVAGWAVAACSTYAATIAFIVYGLLLAIAWVRLFAVDVALTEAAIGSGVTGMLLLSAAARLRVIEPAAVAAGTPLRIAVGISCALISVALAAAILFPPDVVFTLAPAAMAHLQESGLGNPVAGVLFVYRSLDTLLEKAVLLLALLGVWSLAPDRFWGGIPGLQVYRQRNAILIFFAQILPPLGIMVGIYMTWVGADHPGGAFQGGAVLAVMWILVMIAGLRDVPPIGQRWMRLLVVVGPVVFLAIGLAGFALAGAFLGYPAGYAKPFIIVIEVTLQISIAVTLGLLAAGPPERIQPQ
jgi:multisubunit Na+/H+ antiporter MnhB subunit